MEDSYTVHRRRKAAARRREKTPEPRLAASLAAAAAADDEAQSEEMASSMDENEERRARMERMVEDAERMELRAEEKRSRSKSPAVNRAEAGEVKKPSPPTRSRDQPEENASQPIKTSRRVRESSDSAELRRRMGSPEVARTRSSTRGSSDDQHQHHESEQSRTKKRPGSSQRQRRRSPTDEEEEEESSPVPAHRVRRSPAAVKQIIPLSDDCLIQDVARAKRAYAHREPSDDYEYEEDEEEEEEPMPRRRREAGSRRRKPGLLHSDSEKEEISKSLDSGSSSWFSWLPFFGSRKKKVDEPNPDDEEIQESKQEKAPPAAAEKKEASTAAEPAAKPASDKVTIMDFFRSLFAIVAEFREFCRQNPSEVGALIELRNLCIAETVITIVICGLGGFAFRFTEGAFESFYKCGVKRVKRDFLDSLWTYSHNLKEDDWKSLARRKLYEFEEQLHEAHEAGVGSYSGQKSWTFLNSMVYCLTVITTIGYGHISPSTTTGRALTIVYAIIGIPMFLIVLADFGKLFTRGIKFLWAFVRRLYYTGSCRKVRGTVQVQEMMKGVQLVYDLATFRRPSQMSPEEIEEIQRQQQQQQQKQQQTVLGMEGSGGQQPESPSTPAMSTFEIDDEFNLPISVAIAILVLYIIVGAAVFNVFEEWTFFESFYFVFISMSTIGFGDFVPKDPVYMMLSIVYMIFGLALTSMCINVVQVMLADQFKQASQKIGASIGFRVSDEDGSLKPAPPAPVEIADVHTGLSSEAKEKLAPKAKQEDDEL